MEWKTGQIPRDSKTVSDFQIFQRVQKFNQRVTNEAEWC